MPLRWRNILRHHHFSSHQKKGTDMNRGTIVAAILMVGVSATPLAFARGGHAEGDTQSSATTTVSTTAVNVNESVACETSGTRATTASYDPSTGKLSSTLTFSACTDSSGEVRDGSISTAGTLVAKSSTTYTLTASTTVDLTETRGTYSKDRVCTMTRTGTYDLSAQTFSGTKSQSDCSETVVEPTRGDVVQQLLYGGRGFH